MLKWIKKRRRPLSFISLSHSDNQSRVGYKVLQLLQSGCRGECADADWERTEIWPGWIISDAHRLRKKFPVNSIRWLTKKLRHLAGHCCYYFNLFSLRGELLGWGRGWGAFSVCQHKCARSVSVCVWGLVCVRVCVCGRVHGNLWTRVCVCVPRQCEHACWWLWVRGVCVSVCISFTLFCMTKFV